MADNIAFISGSGDIKRAEFKLFVDVSEAGDGIIQEEKPVKPAPVQPAPKK